MIATEIAVFAACLAAGVLTGFVSAFLLTLGEGSRPARAIFDFLTPLFAGGVFFLTLHRFASGVFRLYSLFAFLLGVLLSRRVLKRLSPTIRRALKRVILPIKSLEKRLSARFGRLILPLKRRLASRRDRRREKRRVLRAAREQERKNRQRKKSEKRDRAVALRAKKRMEKRASLRRSERAGRVDSAT